MRPARGSDIAKILAYLAGSLLLGAVIAPWLYNAGKGLAEITGHKQTNGLVAWLAGACENADALTNYREKALISKEMRRE